MEFGEKMVIRVEGVLVARNIKFPSRAQVLTELGTLLVVQVRICLSVREGNDFLRSSDGDGQARRGFRDIFLPSVVMEPLSNFLAQVSSYLSGEKK